MEHPVAVRHQDVDRLGVGQVAGHDLLVVGRLTEIGDVRQPHPMSQLRQAGTNGLAHATGGTGDQEPFQHRDSPSSISPPAPPSQDRAFRPA